MESKWLQNYSLGASGGPLGATSASGASPEGLWLQKKCVVRGLGASLGEKFIDCRAPGGPREGPGGSRSGSGRPFFFSHALPYGIYTVSRGEPFISYGLAEKNRWLSQPSQRK